MSIGKRVSETFIKLMERDPEGAMFQICAAIDETATRESGKLKGTRSDYKAFLSSNLDIILGVGMGFSVTSIRLLYTHSNPDLPTGSDGTCSIEDIIYHVVRCGLYHSASIPENIQFTDRILGTGENGAIKLPLGLICGLAIAVVVSPVNAGERSSLNHPFRYQGQTLRINEWWGRETDFRRTMVS